MGTAARGAAVLEPRRHSRQSHRRPAQVAASFAKTLQHCFFLQVSFGEQRQGGDLGRVDNVSWSTLPAKQVSYYSFKSKSVISVILSIEILRNGFQSWQLF